MTGSRLSHVDNDGSKHCKLSNTHSNYEALQETLPQEIPPPESFDMILTLKARTYDVSEFRSRFHGYETFYFDKKMYTVPFEKSEDVDPWMRDSIEGVMFSILDDLLLDPDVKSLTETSSYSSLELFPFYAQICPNARNGIFPAANQDTATDLHKPRWNPLSPLESNVESRYSKIEILGSLEFQNFAESILEATLYNLMQEANAGEFDVTKYPMLFSK